MDQINLNVKATQIIQMQQFFKGTNTFLLCKLHFQSHRINVSHFLNKLIFGVNDVWRGGCFSLGHGMLHAQSVCMNEGWRNFFIRVDLQKKSCSSCCSESLIYVDKPIIIFYMLELSRRILREIENLIWRARQVIRTQVALVVSSMKLKVCCHNEWEKKWVIQNGKSLFVKKNNNKKTHICSDLMPCIVSVCTGALNHILIGAEPKHNQNNILTQNTCNFIF